MQKVDKAREDMEKKKADFKAGKSLTVSLTASECVCACVCVSLVALCLIESCNCR